MLDTPSGQTRVLSAPPVGIPRADWADYAQWPAAQCAAGHW